MVYSRFDVRRRHLGPPFAALRYRQFLIIGSNTDEGEEGRTTNVYLEVPSGKLVMSDGTFHV